MAATFVHGECRMVDYTPGSAVTAGQVIEIGQRAYVAHNAIEASRLGALSAYGGVYDMTAGEALTAGEEVYVTISSGKLFDATGATTGDPHFGYVVPSSSASADGDTVRVVHMPSGAQAS